MPHFNVLFKFKLWRFNKSEKNYYKTRDFKLFSKYQKNLKSPFNIAYFNLYFFRFSFAVIKAVCNLYQFKQSTNAIDFWFLLNINCIVIWPVNQYIPVVLQKLFSAKIGALISEYCSDASVYSCELVWDDNCTAAESFLNSCNHFRFFFFFFAKLKPKCHSLNS